MGGGAVIVVGQGGDQIQSLAIHLSTFKCIKIRKWEYKENAGGNGRFKSLLMARKKKYL